MTKREALQILIENAAKNVAGAGCGLREPASDKRTKEVRTEVEKWWKDAYSFDLDDSQIRNLGLVTYD
jgi:hypothetical protein